MTPSNSTSAAEPYGRGEFEHAMWSNNTGVNLARFKTGRDDYRAKSVHKAWELWQHAWSRGMKVQHETHDVQRRLAFKHGHDDGVKSMEAQLADLTRERDDARELAAHCKAREEMWSRAASEQHAELAALKASTQAPRVPAGMVLAPKAATSEMEEAGEKALFDYPPKRKSWADACGSIWTAMLAASPTPAETAGPQPLTDERIIEICAAEGLGKCLGVAVSRAIERAHGIGAVAAKEKTE